MPVVRRLRPVLAAALGLVAVSPLFSWGAGAPTGDDLVACKTVRIDKDNWARIKSPTYATGEGDNVIESFAASPDTKGYVYVTNGRVIQASIDAGCKWTHIFPAPAEQNVVDPLATRFTQVVAPSRKSLWALAYDSSGDLPRPHVYWTEDATPGTGNNSKIGFSPVEEGLPPVGKPLEIGVAPSDARRAYLLMEEPVDVDGRSAEVTRTVYRLFEEQPPAPLLEPKVKWEKLTLPGSLGAIDGMVASPRAFTTVWVWSGAKYAWSRDNGKTWKTGTAAGQITTIDVDEGDTAAIYSKATDGGVVELHEDEADQVVATRSTPITVEAAWHGQRTGVAAIAGGGHTYGYDVVDQRWVKITPGGSPKLAKLRFGISGTTGGRILLGNTRTDLYRFDLFALERFVQPSGGQQYYDIGGWVPTPGMTVPVITPTRPTVTVRPGEIAEAPADFGVPPSATPLDVFFLIDSTRSMTEAIKGLKTGVKHIAEQLDLRTRGEACFGLGDIKDWSVNQVTERGNAEDLKPYRLVQPISCDRSHLEAALEKVAEAGGDNYPEEAQTIALTQAVTGKGMTGPVVVEARQDARFRGVGSNGRPPMRVIVLITDAGFKTEPQFDGFPTIEETAKTLNAYSKTKVVGVAVPTTNSPGPAIRDLTEIARLTDTLAPANGIDCNGDKILDVPGGQPLVCQAENKAPAIAPAIVNLLLAVKDPGTLAVDVHDPHKVVADVESKDASVDGNRVAALANLKVENHLMVLPSVTCRAEQDGKDLPVTLRGTIRGSLAAEAEILVRCRAVKVAAPPPPPPPKPPVIEPFVPLPPVKPAPPPVLIPQFQPPPVNNPPGNLNPNAGFSQQEEEQAQLATVSQDASEQEQDDGAEELELAMSGVAGDDAAAATLVLGCATMVAAGAGAVYAQRRRTQRSLRTAYARRD